MRVAIIGMGVVGQAQAELFSKHELVTYDITDEKIYPAAQIAECAFAVVAVGTPAKEDGSADLSHLNAAVSRLPATLPALIRSTVPPGTTAQWQARRKQSHVACAPEFMHERHGGLWEKSSDVPFMILGGSPAARLFFRPLIERAYHGFICELDAIDAEMAKFVANLNWALRVTFVNEMGRICGALGADWDEVREGWLMDGRLGTSEYTRFYGFPPGFGGRCWPDNLAAIIAASEQAGYKPQFLAAVAEANARFRA